MTTTDRAISSAATRESSKLNVAGAGGPAPELWLRERHRRRRRGLVLALLAVLATCLFGSMVTGQYLYIGDSALVAAIGAIGLTVLTGRAGLVSVGNAALLGVGAYAAVMTDQHLPFVPAVLLGGAVAGVGGLLIGMPSLRLRGLYLVFSTLAFHYIVVFGLTEWDNHTHAIAGQTLPTATIGPITILSDKQWFVFLAVLLALVMTISYSILNGRPGRAWAAIHSTETSASIIGVDVVGAKLSAFVYSSVIIGISGAVTAYFVQNITSDYFTISLAVSYVAMVLIGGLGSIGGAVGGAIIVTALPLATQRIGSLVSHGSTGFLQKNLPSIDSGVYGLIVLAFMFFETKGLAGLASKVEQVVVAGVRRLRSGGGER